MATVKAGDKVRVHYTGTLEDGTVFDSSTGRDPLEFTVGEGMVIPGFENAMTDMGPGDTKQVTIPCDQAYGERDESRIFEVPKSRFADASGLQAGMMVQGRGEDGATFQVQVSAVGDEAVTLDGNHPLAGKALIFDLELVEIL